MTEEKKFGSLMLNLRRQQDLDVRTLCDGLCSESFGRRFESGERLPKYLMRERILNRLGITCEKFEIYLDYEEYGEWELRQKLITQLGKRDVKKCEELLEKYEKLIWKRKDKKKGDELQRQFVLSVKIQLEKWKEEQEKVEQEKEVNPGMIALLKEAISLTIWGVLVEQNEEGYENGRSVFDYEQLRSKILAPQEWNLLLEYFVYRLRQEEREGSQDPKLENTSWYTGEVTAFYKAMEQGTRHYEELNKSYILPKAAFYLSAFIKKNIDREEKHKMKRYQMIVKLCNDGIELLRDTERMYYLWELLALKEEAEKNLINIYKESKEARRAESLEKIHRDTVDYKQVMETMCHFVDRSPQMTDDLHLYQEGMVQCMNDVIAIRRKMLHLKVTDVEDICDDKTIRRIEKRQSKSVMEIREGLFKRLGLSGEYQRMEVVSTEPSVGNIIKRLSKAINEYDQEEMKKLINEYVAVVDDTDLPSRQYMQTYIDVTKLLCGEMSEEAFVKQEKELLRATLPIPLEELLQSEGEIYLTDEEYMILYHIYCHETQVDVKEMVEKFLERSCAYLGGEEENGRYIGLYELLRNKIASELGNCGQYEKSNEMSREDIERAIDLRRIGMMDRYYYNIAWNNREAMKEEKEESWSMIDKEIKECLVLSKFCKSDFSETFYREILEK